jgi:hypothetical protein
MLVATADEVIDVPVATVRESAYGTFRTWRDVRLESAFGSKAEDICSQRVFRLLTHSVT